MSLKKQLVSLYCACSTYISLHCTHNLCVSSTNLCDENSELVQIAESVRTDPQLPNDPVEPLRPLHWVLQIPHIVCVYIHQIYVI